MAYIRTKKINNNLYCYLVQNKHTKHGPRQKVKKYLGRAFILKQKKDLDFFDYFQIKNLDSYFQKPRKQILQNLIKFELTKHNFKEKKDLLVNKDLSFNPKNFQTLNNKKETTFSLNEGFLCHFTIKRILNFKKTNDFQKDAHALAKYFIEGGINLPQEVFIQYYQKCPNKKK